MEGERTSKSENLCKRIVTGVAIAGAPIGVLIGYVLGAGTISYTLWGTLTGVAIAIIAGLYASRLEALAPRP